MPRWHLLARRNASPSRNGPPEPGDEPPPRRPLFLHMPEGRNRSGRPTFYRPDPRLSETQLKSEVRIARASGRFYIPRMIWLKVGLRTARMLATDTFAQVRPPFKAAGKLASRRVVTLGRPRSRLCGSSPCFFRELAIDNKVGDRYAGNELHGRWSDMTKIDFNRSFKWPLRIRVEILLALLIASWLFVMVVVRLLF